MRNLDRIRSILKQNKDILRKKYQVKDIGIFGSYVRGEQGEASDLDVLVDFYEPIDLFEFMELERFLERLLGVKVDIVSRKALKPFLQDRILKEVIYL